MGPMLDAAGLEDVSCSASVIVNSTVVAVVCPEQRVPASIVL
jgi:hypothetical protein